MVSCRQFIRGGGDWIGVFAASEYRRAAINEIVAVGRTSQASFALNEQLEALTAAMKPSGYERI